MHEQKFLGILLKKTPLANDDFILEFLTEKSGKTLVFAKNFAKSKKRLEIDFFRLLEVGFFQGRNNKTLKSAKTIKLFTNFMTNFKSSEIGFSWLKELSHFSVEDEEFPFFLDFIKLLSTFSEENINKFNIFFLVKILNINGFFPHFDKIRDNVFFLSTTAEISRTKLPNSVKIENLTRQFLEFCRRSSLAEFLEKKDNLPNSEIEKSLFIVNEIKNNH